MFLHISIVVVVVADTWEQHQHTLNACFALGGRLGTACGCMRLHRAELMGSNVQCMVSEIGRMDGLEYSQNIRVLPYVSQ